MTDRLPTGIGALDRKLGGGIPAGSLVMLSASPASQSEQFLCDLTEVRRSLVMTTRRPREAVEHSLRSTSTRPDNIAVRQIEPRAPLGEIYSFVRKLDGTANLIVDPMDPLERVDEKRFVKFLNAFRSRLVQTDSIGVFHCLDGESPPRHRDTTMYLADVVFDLSTTVRGNRLENQLTVPKLRGGRPFEEAIKLELTDEVAIDTSRDIS